MSKSESGSHDLAESFDMTEVSTDGKRKKTQLQIKFKEFLEDTCYNDNDPDVSYLWS